jgi:hypothetical protein
VLRVQLKPLQLVTLPNKAPLRAVEMFSKSYKILYNSMHHKEAIAKIKKPANSQIRCVLVQSSVMHRRRRGVKYLIVERNERYATIGDM